MSENGLVADVAAAILQAEEPAVCPWEPLLWLRDAIDPGLLASMRDNLPEPEEMGVLPHPEANGKRRFIDLRDCEDLFWKTVQHAIRAGEKLLWQAFLHAFPDAGLPERYGELQARLFFDLPGYKISPHTDAPTKLVTCFLFVDCKGHPAWHGLQVGKPGEEIAIPHEPGTGYAFCPAGNTWHWVKEAKTPRVSLGLIFYR